MDMCYNLGDEIIVTFWGLIIGPSVFPIWMMSMSIFLPRSIVYSHIISLGKWYSNCCHHPSKFVFMHLVVLQKGVLRVIGCCLAWPRSSYFSFSWLFFIPWHICCLLNAIPKSYLTCVKVLHSHDASKHLLFFIDRCPPVESWI